MGRGAAEGDLGENGEQCDVQNSWSTGICGEEKIFMEKPYQRGPQAKEYGLYSNIIRYHQMILSRGVI